MMADSGESTSSKLHVENMYPHGARVSSSDPEANITSAAAYGRYMAVGNEFGAAYVFHQDECTQESVCYEYFSKQQCYGRQTNPLDSGDVSQDITSLAFLPSLDRRPLLLTANERVLKLYKLVSLDDSPAFTSSSGVFLQTKQFPRISGARGRWLTSSTSDVQPQTSFAIQVANQYATHHETKMVSLAPSGVTTDHFFSADYFTVRLWSTEHPESSLETFNILSNGEGGSTCEPTEIIQTLRTFPQCPSLIFVVASGGRVYILDSRQSLRWKRDASVVLDYAAGPDAFADETKWGVNLLTDCALSSSGYQLAGRDLLSVKLMDLRYSDGNASAKLQWRVHPRMKSLSSHIYLDNASSKQFHLQFLDDKTIVTGGLRNQVNLVDVSKAPTSSSVQRFMMPYKFTFPRGLPEEYKEFEIDSACHQSPWPSIILPPVRSVHHNYTSFLVGSSSALLQLSYTP